MDFELPEDLQKETGAQLSLAVKKKILAENTARLYGIDIEAMKAKLSNDQFAVHSSS